MPKPGRDQLGPIERLVRILAVLEDAGQAGVRHPKLCAVSGFTGEPETTRRLLNREINHLRQVGWDIENVAEQAEEARYVLRTRDTRLRVELSPRQQAELARVAKIAALPDFAEYVGTETPGSKPHQPPHDPHDNLNLALCIHAAAKGCLLYFMYKRRMRTVHPRVVQPGPSGWYLVGCEDGQSREKFFVVDRMAHLAIDRSGSARPPEDPERSQLDPATWHVDPPTDVVLETAKEFAPQVALAMGPTAATEFAGDGTARITVTVTHRAAFRRRLYGLGERVTITSPDDVRNEVVKELGELVDQR